MIITYMVEVMRHRLMSPFHFITHSGFCQGEALTGSGMCDIMEGDNSQQQKKRQKGEEEEREESEESDAETKEETTKARWPLSLKDRSYDLIVRKAILGW